MSVGVRTPSSELRARAASGTQAPGQGAPARRLLRRAVHGDPRSFDRQRRAAVDPGEPALLICRPSVGRRRVRDRVRGLLDARRTRLGHFRPAAHVRRRAAAIRSRLAERRSGTDERCADPCARDPGSRRRSDGGVVAGDHHLVVCRGTRTPPRDRPLGRDERGRRRRRHAPWRVHHAGGQLAVGAADQRADRPRGSDRGDPGGRRASLPRAQGARPRRGRWCSRSGF